jgi:NADH-quinone oxidoreductase subunit L
MSNVLLAVWLAPLIGAVTLWAFGPQIKARAGILACAAVLVSFAATLYLWSQGAPSAPVLFHPPAMFPGATPPAMPPPPGSGIGIDLPLAVWSEGFRLGLLLDPLTLLWTLIISGIGFLITVYSIGYMEGDRAEARFFAYMNFFVFAMLTLVLSDNFVGLLIGWGLVGVASYLLIGYYIERPSAVAAARKAFILNVVGDVGLLFAVLVIFNHVGQVNYGAVFWPESLQSFDSNTLFLVCASLFVAVAAKSAQVPLHTWLPDAMEGPTPVSALIHAATMVTAGVYLIARCAPLWSASPHAQELAGWIGAITLFLGAILGCVQWDIKRILAYSTMSQIGYMILGVGVGAYSAGVMHFYTHAFFKALMFLTAGLIIHEIGGEQDVRRMGGLARRMPFAYWCMVVGVVAITGVLPVGGFFSKDAILEGTLGHGHTALYAIGVLGAGLTAFYMFRMLFLTFFGEDRFEIEPALLDVEHPVNAEHHAPHVPAWVMRVPVGTLALGVLLSGLAAVDFGRGSAWTALLRGVFPAVTPAEEHLPFSEYVAILITLSVSVLGVAVAYWRYGAPSARVRTVDGIAAESRGIPALLKQKFYFDEAIDAVFVTPAVAFGLAIKELIEPRVIEGLMRDVVWFAAALGSEVRALQNGLVRSYAFLMVGGVLVALAYFAWMGAPR